MPQAIPQRVITLTIVGNDSDAQVLYTYLSPVTGQSFINAPVCNMVCDRAVYSLFVLDYTSTLNGWTICETSSHDSSPSLLQVPGALNLSIMTFNSFTTEHIYRFYIHYRNSLNGKTMKRDPQETNIPPIA